MAASPRAVVGLKRAAPRTKAAAAASFSPRRRASSGEPVASATGRDERDDGALYNANVQLVSYWRDV